MVQRKNFEMRCKIWAKSFKTLSNLIWRIFFYVRILSKGVDSLGTQEQMGTTGWLVAGFINLVSTWGPRITRILELGKNLR